MITLDTLNHWLAIPKENEHVEFKEAKQQLDKTKILEYCVAFANEGGGHLVLGISDKIPRKVVGTKAFPDTGKIKSYILSELHFRVGVYELPHPDGRVLVFEIPPTPTGHPQHLKGTYLMRSGEELVPMTPDQLRRIFSKKAPDWLAQAAKTDVSGDDVIALLDMQAYFGLMRIPYPDTREEALEYLAAERLIVAKPVSPEKHLARLNGQERDENWTITNLAALLLAKHLDAFSSTLIRKAPRVVICERSTGQAPWHHSRPKGRVQAALAPHLLAPDVLCTA